MTPCTAEVTASRPLPTRTLRSRRVCSARQISSCIAARSSAVDSSASCSCSCRALTRVSACCRAIELACSMLLTRCSCRMYSAPDSSSSALEMRPISSICSRSDSWRISRLRVLRRVRSRRSRSSSTASWRATRSSESRRNESTSAARIVSILARTASIVTPGASIVDGCAGTSSSSDSSTPFGSDRGSRWMRCCPV